MDHLVHLDSVGVSLGGKPVLRDVDLVLEPGQVIGVAGPNGSGKTTLLRMLATLIRIDGGRGEILGADLVSDQVFQVRGSIGMIGHVPALIPELTLRENLVHFSKLSGQNGSGVDWAIEVVGLAEAAERLAEASSFGMKRRIEVAHLLLRKPRLLLLDEALSGLDSSAQDLISALVERTAAADGGVVMVSHDTAQLAGLCHTTMSLSLGRLEAAI